MKEMKLKEALDQKEHTRKRENSKKQKRRSKSRRRHSRSPDTDRSRSNSSKPKGKMVEEKSDDEKDRPRAQSTHSHSHAGHSEDAHEGMYIDVPIEGFLLKKNFDYIMVDKDDIEEYTGRSETRINQMLKVPFTGTIQLVSLMISQMYADSRVDMKSDLDIVVVGPYYIDQRKYIHQQRRCCRMFSIQMGRKLEKRYHCRLLSILL